VIGEMLPVHAARYGHRMPGAPQGCSAANVARNIVLDQAACRRASWVGAKQTGNGTRGRFEV